MADECRIVEVDGEQIRVHGGAEMDEADREAFAQIVRAAKARMAAEDARDATHASDPTPVGTTGRLDVKTAQTGAQHSNERNEK